MNRFLYWGLRLGLTAYTGFMWGNFLGEWAMTWGQDSAAQADWAVKVGLGMVVLWLLPVASLWLLARAFMAKAPKPSVTSHPIRQPDSRPVEIPIAEPAPEAPPPAVTQAANSTPSPRGNANRSRPSSSRTC